MGKWDEILERDLKQAKSKKYVDDIIEAAWKSVPNFTGFTGAVSTDPLSKAVRKFFEDAYVPLDTKEKTFLEQVVVIDDED